MININLPIDESHDQQKSLNFLIDTGAGISIIKAELLHPELLVDVNKKLNIQGITESKEPCKTMGRAKINLNIKNKKLDHLFHIVNNKRVPTLKYDGILGDDFLTQNNAKINYATKNIEINNIIVPFTNYEQEKETFYVLNPRTETLLKANIINPEAREGIIENQKIMEGIYLSGCITKVDNDGQAYISILNSTDKKVEIKSLTLKLESIGDVSPSDEININHIGSTPISDNYNLRLSRTQKLRKELRVTHLNQEEQQSLFKICDKFSDIFYLDGDQLSSTNSIQHEINTDPQKGPIHTKTYRYPEVHKAEVNTQITKMLNDGVIRPSTSPWSSPLWVVPKKKDASGKIKWRVVIDYRKLNDITIGDAYPLPNISDILDQLGNSKYFSTLDLASGFHQIKMNPRDIPKTAFSTPTGLYEY